MKLGGRSTESLLAANMAAVAGRAYVAAAVHRDRARSGEDLGWGGP